VVVVVVVVVVAPAAAVVEALAAAVVVVAVAAPPVLGAAVVLASVSLLLPVASARRATWQQLHPAMPHAPGVVIVAPVLYRYSKPSFSVLPLLHFSSSVPTDVGH